MIKVIALPSSISLDNHSSYTSLVMGVRELRTEAAALIPKMGSRKIWMINSAEHGGGVAEMMPGTINILRQLGDGPGPSFFINVVYKR